jgi:hypothetical protein
MVFLILSRTGFEELKALLGKCPSPCWVNGDVFSEQELEELRQKGEDISRFSYVISKEDFASLEAVLNTIRDHHPQETIWVECLGGDIY